MRRQVVAMLLVSLFVSTLQDTCSIVFNNIHNGYRYNVSGDCTITADQFSIMPDGEELGEFDKKREVQEHIIHKQPDGSYKVDVSKTRTSFGDQEFIHEDAVQFVLMSEKVREVAVAVFVKSTQVEILERYLRSHAKSTNGDL